MQLERSKVNPLPCHISAVSLANDFLRYFTDKIFKLWDDLDAISSDPSSANISIGTFKDSVMNMFTEFKPLSENDIAKLVFSSKTTCELDVFPTNKLKGHFTQLAPVVTEIVTRSLLSSVCS
ncbi:hypothetical protein DPMN_191784 [Dreissena polymorpha]|uniref:Uncharacterized protein n=1 Tax=Dreissena polymorpha TaxID=45954 RepID=A0A9D4B5J1_DREPO|nr:hypothetical protein DPMN_191784 [Dreissena polymorpha]